ncbi:hypothetical protein, partial [Ureibacillus terrenus]|uniref:hypothetical protein n=1 Tax=Ureibacillus terrenus TaxID=118246 RepID=UPI002E1CF6C5|nr:hypothetical protein [Ureibacillus terrenus]
HPPEDASLVPKLHLHPPESTSHVPKRNLHPPKGTSRVPELFSYLPKHAPHMPKLHLHPPEFTLLVPKRNLHPPKGTSHVPVLFSYLPNHASHPPKGTPPLPMMNPIRSNASFICPGYTAIRPRFPIFSSNPSKLNPPSAPAHAAIHQQKKERMFSIRSLQAQTRQIFARSKNKIEHSIDCQLKKIL